MASLVAAGSSGRRGTVMPGAEAIHPIKLIGVEPHAYLTDVITRIVAGHPNRRLDELLPWSYPAISALSAVA